MIDWTPLFLSLFATVFAYWIVIRITPHLPKIWRLKIIIGYASIHLCSWLIMHLLVSTQFERKVLQMQSKGLAAIPAEIAAYRSATPNPDLEYIQHIERRVAAKPWHSVWSVAPIPFVLVASENYQIGPLWGLGMTRVYLWHIFSLRCVTEKENWIS